MSRNPYKILRNNIVEDEDDLIISISSLVDDSQECLLSNNNTINVACTNARSIVEKIESLSTLFEENSLHLALLTETWLTQKACSVRRMNDLTEGKNISFIRRDRGARGEGVAIAFNPTRIRMKKYNINNSDRKSEIICAVGTCSLTARKVAAISVYLSPSIRASELTVAMETCVETISKLKTDFREPLVMVGDDFNGKDISALLSAHCDLVAINAGATRNGRKLDKIYTLSLIHI